MTQINSDIKIYHSQDFPAYLPKLNLLYDDLFSDGKGFRAKLVRWMAEPMSLDASLTKLLCQTIEFIHNASLLHDDLIDRSQLRRGKPAAWTKYTPEYAVLAGDYLLARVMVNLSEFGNIKLVHYTAQMISDLLEGEWLQDSVVGDFFVNPEQLDRIHHLKTASLFKWCMRAPYIAVKNDDPVLHDILDHLGTILGLLFQRSDDLLDFDIRNHEGKAILGDLKSGYVNSFAAFMFQKLSKAQIELAVSSKTLPELFERIGGEKVFQEKLALFDANNSKLIDLYFHHLERLQTNLNVENTKMISTLRKLPDLLYWRKKPN